MNQRNAPWTVAVLALPLLFLTHCTSGDDTGDLSNVPPYVPMPPVVECTTADQCTFPPSSCASATMLLYYTNARCESGHCKWDHSSMACQGSCSNGACLLSGPTTTAAGGPPFDPCTGDQSNTPACVGGAGGSGDDEDAGSLCEPDDDGGPGQCVALP